MWAQYNISTVLMLGCKNVIRILFTLYFRQLHVHVVSSLWLCFYVYRMWVSGCKLVWLYMYVSLNSPSLSHSDSGLSFCTATDSTCRRMLFVFRGAQLLQQQSHSIIGNSIQWSIVFYELSLTAKATQTWWNGHVLLLAATAHEEHTSSTPC